MVGAEEEVVVVEEVDGVVAETRSEMTETGVHPRGVLSETTIRRIRISETEKRGCHLTVSGDNIQERWNTRGGTTMIPTGQSIWSDSNVSLMCVTCKQY